MSPLRVSFFENEKRYPDGRLSGCNERQSLYSGMIRLHILYHASEGLIFGASIIEERGRHGYQLTPGTLYPILHGLDGKGYLRSTEKRERRQPRRFYGATHARRKALRSANEKVRELRGELFKE